MAGVQRVLDGRELLLSEVAEVCCLWEIFADQTIGVFIGSALPG